MKQTQEHADMQSTSQQQQQQQKTKYILYACFRNKMKYCIKIYKHPPPQQFIAPSTLPLVHFLWRMWKDNCKDDVFWTAWKLWLPTEFGPN